MFCIWFCKGNVTIVDTPGTGDFAQEEVAKKMRSYLPNALAFVFVVNVPNAGGLQDDRVYIICYFFIHFKLSRNLIMTLFKKYIIKRSWKVKDFILILKHVVKRNKKNYLNKCKNVMVIFSFWEFYHMCEIQ